MHDLPYGIAIRSDRSMTDAEALVREALAEEGFGILSEIDVSATLKQKIDRDLRPYKILGACNPHLASRALDADEHIGLLLPCNVLLYETDAGTAVEALEPSLIAQLAEADELDPIAAEARERIVRALAAVEAA